MNALELLRRHVAERGVSASSTIHILKEVGDSVGYVIHRAVVVREDLPCSRVLKKLPKWARSLAETWSPGSGEYRGVSGKLETRTAQAAVMDHRLGPPLPDRHVQRPEYEFRPPMRLHRPATTRRLQASTTTARQRKPAQGGHVAHIRHPEPVRTSHQEVSLDEGRGRSYVRRALRRTPFPAAARTLEALELVSARRGERPNHDRSCARRGPRNAVMRARTPKTEKAPTNTRFLGITDRIGHSPGWQQTTDGLRQRTSAMPSKSP